MNQSTQNEEKEAKNEFINFKININKKGCEKYEIAHKFQECEMKIESIPIEKCIKDYDEKNFNFLINNETIKYEKMKNYFNQSLTITPKELQEQYGDKVIEIIEKMQKSDIFAEFPSLPYGKSLTDAEFINLLEKCVLYCSFSFDNKSINYIKDKLIKRNKDILKNLFVHGQYKKDVFQNALLTILTSKKRTDQEDNFKILNMKFCTSTPFIKMDFNNDKKLRLDIEELKQIYCSPVYLQNYQNTLKDFLPESHISIEDEKLKEYIKDYFDNHYIYFCDLPDNILAFIIHTGNIYLKTKYLFEYYNDTDYESQIIIREKIKLNIGHELMHALLREISDSMKKNFLINSNNKNNSFKNGNISFKNKFNKKIKLLNANESGNVFDFNFFNNYYFNNIFPKEAEFFKDIKNYKNFNEYKKSLENIINEERNFNLSENSINKFKKLEDEDVRTCIKSKIFHGSDN